MFVNPRIGICLVAIACLSLTVPHQAFVYSEKSSQFADKEIQHPDLMIDNVYRELGDLPTDVAALAYQDLEQLGVSAEHARLDPRTGRWGTVITTEPLLPGDGVGNRLRWDQLGLAEVPDGEDLEEAAWEAFRAYLEIHSEALRIDVNELSSDVTVTLMDGQDLVHIYIPRTVGGVKVRDSYIAAVINHGNLVLYGTHGWGDVNASARPSLAQADAHSVLSSHLDSLKWEGEWRESELVLLPLAQEQDVRRVTIGQGVDYRLVWVLYPTIADGIGQWEALIDAQSGELLAFADIAHYAAEKREVKGGVLPVTNDGVAPDGVEQPGWPMPFDEVTTSGGTVTTDAGGNMPTGTTGLATSNLDGEFIRMNDNCGPISLSSTGDIDFGTNAGTDCATPGFGGAGNTRSSRSGFHELNRMRESAVGHLPGNIWLQQELTSNMNIPSACNAFYNFVSINFFRSGCCFGGNPCSNTGEIGAVFDHEWGHGMDDHDAVPGISNPGEGIADLYAALRLNTSCIGRNFTPGATCLGYGDPCNTCTGIRDIDWANRASGVPHDVAWSIANCGFTPHCRGAVYAEAVWDLYTRDLPTGYGMDSNTALEVTTRLNFLGAGMVGTWFQNVVPFGGCNADSGYLRFLAADDDNGNLADGTPHMKGIFTAFDRHGAACNVLTVQDSGCAGTPTVPPVVTITPGDTSAHLSWTPSPGATEYEIFRTDGVFGCDFGKAKVGSTSGTSFTDTGLQNDRKYSYIVIPKGPNDSCFGPASTCEGVAPVSCCDQKLTDSEFFLSAPGNLSVSDSNYSYCAMAGAKHQSGSYCWAEHNSGTGNWDFTGVGPAASCGYICIDRINKKCPCDPFFEEFFLTGTTNQTLSGTDYAYCAIGGAKHDPNTGYCWADYNGLSNTWNLSSINSSCNFVCIPEKSTCSNFKFKEFTLNGPATQTESDSDFSFCAVSGDKHTNNGYCWVDHNTVAGTWQLQAVGQATCNFECIVK